MRVRIKPIIPKRLPASVDEYEEAIEKVLDQLAAESKVDYEKTVDTWKTKVRFTIRKTKFGRSVGTNNKIFFYVDQGTRPHLIRARRAKRLAFYATGFRAKTRPHTISSYKGAAANANFTRPLVVAHPGTEARRFSAVITTRYKHKQPAMMKKALKELAKR